MSARGADKVDVPPDGIQNGLRIHIISGGPHPPLTVYDYNSRYVASTS